MLMPCLRRNAGILPSAPSSRTTRDRRLDVMRPILNTRRTLPWLLMGALAAPAFATGALAQTAAPPKSAAPKAAVAKKPAAAPQKLATGERPAAASPAASPTASLAPLAEEADHVARYDVAIAPTRDHALSADDSAKLRESIADAAGGRIGEAK